MVSVVVVADKQWWAISSWATDWWQSGSRVGALLAGPKPSEETAAKRKAGRPRRTERADGPAGVVTGRLW